METVKVVLDWFPNTNHTGLLLAQARGWFREAGLAVSIQGDVHGVMDTHGADFVLGPEISMLDCRQKGTPLTGIAVLTQKCDSGIVSLKRAGITRPRELEGKRLTHWAPAWFHAAIRRVMAQDGGDYDKVQLVQLDVGDIVATLGQQADATWVYENWENQVLLEAGKEINYFNLGDFDPIFDFCAPAIAAPESVLEQRPEMVRKFLAILDRAYRLAAHDPDAAVLAVRSALPSDCSEQLLLRSQRHLAPILLDAQGRWGRIRPERWDRMAEFLLTCGVITQRWPREYTNAYFADAPVSVDAPVNPDGLSSAK
ncbi:MAG: ABC transporter substrate-binding protein [Oscillospiraceae bacterium]|nr:ABC transporter substrate-binding protein [Oscillospiraceae bacterium]MDD4368071.1 ABC transporter substrate-binding protein [Oscillospiraceae bacterium]